MATITDESRTVTSDSERVVVKRAAGKSTESRDNLYLSDTLPVRRNRASISQEK